MLPQVTIEPVAISDIHLLRAVAVKAYTEHYADTWYDGGAWYIETYFNTECLAEEMQTATARFFLIVSASHPVGFLKLNLPTPLTGDAAPAIEVERIYLYKSASGSGIGTQVMRRIFQMAIAENVKKVWLKVMDSNPAAVRFYAKCGFEICGTHEVSFPQKKRGMRGMYIMQKIV